MTALKYGVRQDGDAFVWEVVTDDGRVIARGLEPTHQNATTTAMLAGMRVLTSMQEVAKRPEAE